MNKTGKVYKNGKMSSRKGSKIGFALYYFLVFLSFLLLIA